MWFVHALNAALLGLLIWLAIQFPESEMAFWLAIAGPGTALGFYSLARWGDLGSSINMPLMDEVYRLPKEEQQVVFERAKPLLYLVTMTILLMASWISFAAQGTLGALTAEQAVLIGVVVLLGMELFVLWGWFAWFNHKTSQHIRAYEAQQAAAPKDDTPAKSLLEVDEVATSDPLPGIRPVPEGLVWFVHAVNIALVVLLVGAVLLLPEQWPDTLIGALIGLPCAGIMYACTWLDSSYLNMYKKPLILALPATEQEAIFQRVDMLLFGFAMLILLMGTAVAVLSTEALKVQAVLGLTVLMVVGAFAHHRWFGSYLNERLAAYEDHYGISEAAEETASS